MDMDMDVDMDEPTEIDSYRHCHGHGQCGYTCTKKWGLRRYVVIILYIERCFARHKQNSIKSDGTNINFSREADKP
jgi:hypothetical protein